MSSPEANLNPVTALNVAKFPIEHGFRDGADELWRPISLIAPGSSNEALVLALDVHGKKDELPLDAIPFVHYFTDGQRGSPSEHMATLHHRKGGTTHREGQLRILGIANRHGSQQAEFYHGDHQDHPGETGFFLRARHLGFIGLHHLGKPDYLVPNRVQSKFFPVPRVRSI